MSLVILKDRYLNYLAVQGYAKGTIRYRGIYLEQFFLFLLQKGVTDVREITRETIHNYQVFLSQFPYSPLTIHSKLSVLSCFFFYLFENNHLFTDLSAVITFPKRVLGLPKNILTETEAQMFLSLPNVRTRKGIRDKAILELLYSTAIRRAELIGLDLYDLNLDDQTIKVMGKGNKERMVPFGSVVKYWVTRYIQDVRKPKAAKENALFLDLVCGHRLSEQRLGSLIREYLNSSGIKKRITPHSFRHTCATHLLKNGADIRYIQEMLGHASPETTQIYTRVEIGDLDAVFRNTHPRGRRI